MDTYRQLLDAGSAKDQLELFKALSTPTAAKPPADDAPVDVPDVDLNNPMRQPEAGVRLEDGTILTDAIADRILGSVEPYGRHHPARTTVSSSSGSAV